MNLLGKKIKTGLLAIITLAVVAIGCEAIRDLKTFEIDYDTTVQIPSSSVFGGLVESPPRDIETNTKTELERNDTKSKWVKSIFLEEMTATIESGDSDFDFLNSIEIFVSAEGLEEVRLASLFDVPQNVTKIDLNPGDCNLKSYFKKGAISIRSVANASNNSAVTIDVDMVFEVEARIKLFN